MAILTLALGIGAGTTMFSVIKNVMLSPFPYQNPEQIVYTIWTADARGEDPT